MPRLLAGFLRRRFVEDRFLFLLISILSLLLISPLIRIFVQKSLLFDVFSTAILLSGVYAASRKKVSYRLAVALAIPMLVSTWVSVAVGSRTSVLLSDFFTIVFLGFTVVVIFGYIAQVHEITADAIYGAVAVYLLIGILWGYLYAFLEVVAPGSFELSRIAAALLEDRRLALLYYSFVTLTTLGYGDITATTPIGVSLTIVEAVLGQMYLAVMIARIVGIHVAQSAQKDARR